jgi:ADP-ribose pyrophosphatase YjhB (NUDIX family)
MNYFQAFKFCPVCGNKYESADFKAEGPVFICPKCGYKFFQDMKPTVTAVIPNANNTKELMVSERNQEPNKGMFSLPGGFLKYGEKPEEGLIREMKEEFDLDLEIERLLSVKINDYPYEGFDYKHTTIYYLAKPIISLPEVLQLEEVASCKFVDIEHRESFESQMALKPDLEVMNDYLASSSAIA